jgi:hypothetical protein
MILVSVSIVPRWPYGMRRPAPAHNPPSASASRRNLLGANHLADTVTPVSFPAGVICLVQVRDGSIREGDRITGASLGTGESFSVQEVGVLCPYQLRTRALLTGQFVTPSSSPS